MSYRIIIYYQPRNFFKLASFIFTHPLIYVIIHSFSKFTYSFFFTTLYKLVTFRKMIRKKNFNIFLPINICAHTRVMYREWRKKNTCQTTMNTARGKLKGVSRRRSSGSPIFPSPSLPLSPPFGPHKMRIRLCVVVPTDRQYEISRGRGKSVRYILHIFLYRWGQNAMMHYSRNGPCSNS